MNYVSNCFDYVSSTENKGEILSIRPTEEIKYYISIMYKISPEEHK